MHLTLQLLEYARSLLATDKDGAAVTGCPGKYSKCESLCGIPALPYNVKICAQWAYYWVNKDHNIGHMRL